MRWIWTGRGLVVDSRGRLGLDLRYGLLGVWVSLLLGSNEDEEDAEGKEGKDGEAADGAADNGAHGGWRGNLS